MNETIRRKNLRGVERVGDHSAQMDEMLFADVRHRWESGLYRFHAGLNPVIFSRSTALVASLEMAAWLACVWRTTRWNDAHAAFAMGIVAKNF